MNKRILIATGNPHKVEEIRQILGDDMEIFSLKDAGISVDIDENGATFADNAIIKVRALKDKWEGIVVADDSGLSIDALDGRPGVHSSRFLGEETPYDKKNKKILEMLEGLPEEKRGARFVCAVACALEDGTEHIMEGVIEGRIHTQVQGKNGFGYDPIFFVPEYNMTTAMMDSDQKNKISHRGKAFMKLKSFLQKEG